ncbi:tryptophan synthase alpha chain [Isoptericola sp. CG 20/1183]|uniref:Tryptophan synthase alpha chain n=1 Tax=Isoptericola halotolerans TaxID=300560 RepID=A0ABX5EA78_9MICO|nr:MULTISPECIES: tryptophan synthase subunit alpha [Isoptericola]MCK0115789.1 tryptophan synthase subunit alpha [Isoptericola sp. S6320L]PRZ03452.1 tryptophan synthase alpha chain [Isoptericola sp. CG 20/1183]PRZ03739.1 tryptophan synthase alpha chain [Isoptericola halotolerans]
MSTATTSRTAARLDELAGTGRAALVGYLPVGFPDVARSVEAVTTMVDAGVDVVEIGVPYTDPVMDGPVIQRAAEAALAAGARVRDVLTVVEAVAEHSGGTVPALVMSYYNPVLRYGVEAFARDLAAAGGAGMITPDLIPDEAAEWSAAADELGLDKVYLVAPSSTAERLHLTARASRGFVYAASTMGVTGTRESVGLAAEELVTATRSAGADHVCVGLGVSTGEQAAEVGRYADGVIVGSALVRTLLSDDPWTDRLDALGRVTGELAAGVARARTTGGDS